MTGDQAGVTDVEIRQGGLTEAEAASRLARHGFNELARPEKRTMLRIAIGVMREPMLALLAGGGVIYLLLGDVEEAAILLVFGCLSMVITVVQERRTERVLEALRDLTSPRALVIREGKPRRIPGREVVNGDLLVLVEGDRVAADAKLLQCQELEADESLLTGESIPVRKLPVRSGGPEQPARPGGDDLPYVFAGALIVRGTGMAEVTATGRRSEIGKIGQSLALLDIETPRLQLEMRRIIRFFGLAAAVVSIGVGLLYGLFRGGWLAAVLAGITLGMSLLPEEFPVVLTVFMAMGAWRISRARVLTRRAAAIEALGSATVLCTDKTGTLTENRMAVAELWLATGKSLAIGENAADGLPPGFDNLIRCAALASAPKPFDPMEKAFRALAGRRGAEATDWRLVKVYGLQMDLLAVTQVWEAPEQTELIVAAKGAPEAIAGLCGLRADSMQRVKAESDEMASRGLRVLGIAQARLSRGALPESPHGFRLTLLGLAGLADPLREGVPAAIAECRSAGIRVVMVTGDYPATAQAIARKAGIDSRVVVSGDEILRLSESELKHRVSSASVFARIMPEQKLRIVNAFKANGEVVAMTGDGVNDAPSLKSANIGIAMGGRGTDVAREAAAIVLLDDDFGSIVSAVRLGRRIYDNLRKAIAFICGVHVPIAGLALLPLLSGLPIIFGPVHIAFLEMVIDPVCSLVFEAEIAETEIMRRPPRSPTEPMLSRRLLVWGALQGVVAFALPAAIYLVSVHRGLAENEIRALTFFSLVTAIIALIFVNRSFTGSLEAALRRPNTALVSVLLLIGFILGLTLWWPAAQELFRFGQLHADDLALTTGAGLVVLIILEMLKPVLRRAA